MSATETPSGLIHPVVLSSDVGSRLWPLSRDTYSKQSLTLANTNTLLQDTAARVAAPDFSPPPLLTGIAEHRFIIAVTRSGVCRENRQRGEGDGRGEHGQ